MEKNEVKNIYQRIRDIMADIDYIQKGPKKAGGMYTYVSHDAVSEAIHPLLVKHGVVVIPTVKSMTQDENRTCMCLSVKFVNCDIPDDNFSIETWGYGIDTGDKGPGKCFSYSFKYALLKTFCLETGDDPDHDQDAKFEPKKEEKRISPEKLGMITAYDIPIMTGFKNYILKTYKIKDYYEILEKDFDSIYLQMKNVYANLERKNGV